MEVGKKVGLSQTAVLLATPFCHPIKWTLSMTSSWGSWWALARTAVCIEVRVCVCVCVLVWLGCVCASGLL